MPRQTIVFYTTQTSASGSCRRILTELNQKQRTIWHVGHERFVKGADFRFAWTDVKPEDSLVFANCPRDLGTIQDLAGQGFIVNFRDPRDRLCNEFMWKLIHPRSFDEPKEEIEARAAKILEKGIDRWIEEGMGRGPLAAGDDFKLFMDNVDRIPAENRHIFTYARLCTDFDSFLAGVSAAMGVELTTELKEALEVERTEKLEENPQWIGNKWNGSDVMPGRYKRELKPETIGWLSAKYADVLRAMARHDPDYADLYLEDVPSENRIVSVPEAPSPAAPIAAVVKELPYISHTIIDRPDIRIDHFRNKVRSDTLIFTFSDRESRDIADMGFGTGFLLHNGMDVVAIKTSQPMWFENLLPGDIVEIERWLSWTSQPYTLRAGYGSSMGAYGAIRYAAELKLDRVLALSPLFDIKNDWEKRWRSDVDIMNPDRGMFALPDDPNNGNAVTELTGKCEYLMVFDPLDPDMQHIRRFAAIIPADKLRLLSLPYSGHPSGQYLLELGVLGPVAIDGLKTGIFPPVTQARRENKARSSIYLFHLVQHCLRRGHEEWALAINKKLTAIKDHPEYHMQACKIYDAMGRYDEALAAVDRAMGWKDYIFRPHFEHYRNHLVARREAAVAA